MTLFSFIRSLIAAELLAVLEEDDVLKTADIIDAVYIPLQ